MKTRRLTKKEMWIFAVGQLGWSILGGIINAWLVTFYLPSKTDVEAGANFYIPIGLIFLGVLTVLGLITFVCRIFDAVTDPLIATLSDKSNNKRGRRIPFMQLAAIPFSITLITAESDPSHFETVALLSLRDPWSVMKKAPEPIAVLAFSIEPPEKHTVPP